MGLPFGPVPPRPLVSAPLNPGLKGSFTHIWWLLLAVSWDLRTGARLPTRSLSSWLPGFLTAWWLAGRGHVFNDPALKSQQVIWSHLLCHITWAGTARGSESQEARITGLRLGGRTPHHPPGKSPGQPHGRTKKAGLPQRRRAGPSQAVRMGQVSIGPVSTLRCGPEQSPTFPGPLTATSL